MYAQYRCIMLHVTLIRCMVLQRSIVNMSGGRSILSIYALCYM